MRLVALLLTLAAAGALALGLPALGTAGAGVLGLGLALPWLGGCAWVWRNPGRLGLRSVLAIGLLLRLAASLPTPQLSSDCYRYAWDARVQRHGVSPYRYPPQAPELASLRDPLLHPQINRPWARTVYPPGAQLFFLALLPDDLWGLRWLMIACDLVTIGLIGRLLRELGLDPGRALLYAACPLVVMEVGNNGHLEAAVLPWLLAAVLWARAGREGMVGLALGVASSLKLYPALALVALGRRAPLRVGAVMASLVGSLYLIYGATVGVKVLGFLPNYVRAAEDHNIWLRRWFELVINAAAPSLPHPRELAFGLCLLLLLLGLAWVARQAQAPLSQRMLWVAGLYLLLLPTALHPWYALWLIPWLCLYPQPGWLWLISLLPFSYLKYATVDGVMPPWVVPLEWLPTVALLALAWWRQR